MANLAPHTGQGYSHQLLVSFNALSLPCRVLLASTVLLLIYLASSIAQKPKHALQEDKTKTPPIYPSYVPFVGHAVSMVWDPSTFLSSIT